MPRFEREQSQYERLQELEAQQRHRIATAIRDAADTHTVSGDFVALLDPNFGFYHDTAVRRMSHELPGLYIDDVEVEARRARTLQRLSTYAQSLAQVTSPTVEETDAVILQFPIVTVSDTQEAQPLPAVGN